MTQKAPTIKDGWKVDWRILSRIGIRTNHQGLSKREINRVEGELDQKLWNAPKHLEYPSLMVKGWSLPVGRQVFLPYFFDSKFYPADRRDYLLRLSPWKFWMVMKIPCVELLTLKELKQAVKTIIRWNNVAGFDTTLILELVSNIYGFWGSNNADYINCCNSCHISGKLKPY
jgi:hypothetical protein